MKIAIVGYGVEGRSNYRYYRAKYPEAEIVIFDERAQLDDTPEGAQLVLGGSTKIGRASCRERV